MTAYAGATWDWFQTHLDSTAARRAGLPAAIVDGQMLGALLATHAQDGIGAGARVLAMRFRNSGAVYRDDTILIDGRVVESRYEADVELLTVEQNIRVVGDESRVAIKGAYTTVEFPALRK